MHGRLQANRRHGSTKRLGDFLDGLALPKERDHLLNVGARPLPARPHGKFLRHSRDLAKGTFHEQGLRA